MEGFSACFEGLEDPRTGNAGRHDLLEILIIALCTVLSGGQTAVDMAEFAQDKEAFLRGSVENSLHCKRRLGTTLPGLKIPSGLEAPN